MYKWKRVAIRTTAETPEREQKGSSGHEHKGRTGTAITVTATIFLMVMVLAGCSNSSPGNTIVAAGPATAVASPDTITVIGKATVSSAPDEAVLTLTVESDGADPGTSMNDNSAAVTAVLERLKAEGVDDASIETANVSVYPVRTYNPETGEETLTGYRAQNSIRVTLSDAEQVGKVLSAAVEAGVNILSGPVWKLSDDAAAVRDALKQATDNARTKAEALAEAQGVTLGNVLMMNENSVVQPVYPSYSEMYDMRAGAAGTVADTPISAASLDVTATVTVTYVLER
jgi:uncharacterized protein YggE